MKAKHWIVDGLLVGFLDKLEQLCLLSLCWFPGSLPLVIVGTAATAL